MNNTQEKQTNCEKFTVAGVQAILCGTGKGMFEEVIWGHM